MNIYDIFPINLLIGAAYWLVTTISSLITPFAGAQSAAIAVVLLTLVTRALLIPVGRSQMKANITRQRLAPRIAELQRKYRKNPELLQRKTMELYKEEKASPFAGCLPVLAQMPVLMAVYGLFILPQIGGHDNELLSQSFLGIPLGSGFVPQIAAGAVDVTSTVVFVAIMLLIAVVAQASRKLLPQPQMGGADSQGRSAVDRPAGMPDLSGMTRVLSFMPFMTAVIAAFVPLAAALYLLVTTSWTFVERLILGRIYGVGREPQST